MGEGLVTILIALIPILVFNMQYRIIMFLIFVIIATFPGTYEFISFSTIFQKAVPIEIMGRFNSVRSIF